jgi:hypothetical protein
MAALTLASMGSVAFAMPAAAARSSTESATDSIRSGPYASRHVNQAPATGARTGKPAVSPRIVNSCDSTFHQVTSPNPGLAYNAISNSGMASISSTDVWAVGAYGQTNAGPDQTLAMQWNGSAWSQVTTPNTGVGNDDLWGVATVPGATADIGNVWAVGDYTDGSFVEHPQALQWVSPGAWNPNTPVNIPGSAGNNILFGVTAITATNVWAVGNWRQSNGDPNVVPPVPPSPARTLIGHWDGTTFTTIQGPDVTTTSSDRLISVSGSGASDVWAVGRTTDNSVDSALILHYNGTTWSIIPSANPSTTSNTLYSVKALSPTLAYAVGDYKDVNGRDHTLIEKWDGAFWTVVPTGDVIAGYDSFLFSLSGISSTDIWAAGATYAPNGALTPSYTFAKHFDGTSWKAVLGLDGNPGNFNEFNAILETSPTEIWGGGDYVNGSNQLVTLTDRLCMAIPAVTSVVPISGNNTGGSAVIITGTDFNFATAVKFGTTAAGSFTGDSNRQITAIAPPGSVGAVDVTVTNAAGTSATSNADTYVYVPPAISWQQYSLAGSNGANWVPIDATNLSTSFSTGSATANAILSGNADLWTSLAGVNQDLGILVKGGTYGVNGMVVAWKESGGYAGTFSPNAAFVQTVIPIVGSTLYTAQLVWKSNKPTSGIIFAAAGAGPAYSPSRLTVELVPTPTTVEATAATNTQYLLNGNDGSTWKDMDATNLVITNFTPTATSTGLVSANADLWTTVAGVNQDIGIWISGGTYGTNGTLVAWKESGGFGGTYSPNAAFVQTKVTLTAATQYTLKLQWKTNKLTTSTIVAGAGAGPMYSPTRLTLRLFPTANTLVDGSTNKQYNKAGSTGADWTPIDSTGLQIMVTPTATSVWVLSANGDLFTATAGINQDLGIFISGGVYGTGTLVAWKESGGYGGVFSPNAAFVQTVMPLASGTTYTITLEWKANRATSGTIYVAAGSGPAPNYSPTRITAQLLS